MKPFNLVSRCVIIALVSLLMPISTMANSGGKTGGSMSGCGGCHGGASANTTAVLEGPRVVKAGSNNAYSFVVAHPTLRNAGFNLSFRSGTSYAGTLVAGANTQLRSNELTHNQAAAFGADGARFAFAWTAPATHGVVSFAGVGNAVNNDGNDSDADDWALSGTVTITVTGANFTKPLAASSFCTGTTMDVQWQQTGLGQVRIEMSKDDFVTTEVITTAAAATLSASYQIPPTLPAGTYVMRMVDATTQEEITRTGQFSVQAGPNFTLQPEPTFVCAGKTLTLTVSSVGGNILYRWKKNGVDIPGGTNPVLTINQATQAEAGKYQCVAFACSTSLASNEVEVTVGVATALTRQPLPRAVCEGDTASFSVGATGSNLRYQWLKNGAPLVDDTLSVLRFPTTMVLDEATYSCRVEGSCGASVTSSAVKLDVTEAPKIRTQPLDKSLRVGDTLILSVEASGESLVYQWYRDDAVLPSAKDRLLRIIGVAKSDSGVYRCVVFNQCDTVSSKTCTVKIVSVAGPGKLTLTSSALSLGQSVACLTKDTTITGLLVNEGGSPVTITSISAEPIAKIEVVNLRAPLTLAVNERRDLQLRITPKDFGSYQATVSFFTSIGSQTYTVTGEGTPALKFAQDTLLFPKASMGVRLCNESVAIPCDATKITNIRLSGAGATTWTLSQAPDTPLTLKSGEKFTLCVESTQESGDEAFVTVTTDFGQTTFMVRRSDVTSVDADDDDAAQTKVRVYPNPAVSEVMIKGLSDESMTISIYNAAGDRIHTMQGSGELRWDRRDMRGALVPGGLYVLSIDGTRSGHTVRKLILQ